MTVPSDKEHMESIPPEIISGEDMPFSSETCNTSQKVCSSGNADEMLPK